MKRNQLTITYPAKDPTDLHQMLHHLKTTQHLNLSAFCREAITEKLERLNQNQNQQEETK